MEMIAAQMPAELKRARADFVIDNDGTLTQLERRVQDVWTALLERGVRAAHAPPPFLDTVFQPRIDSARTTYLTAESVTDLGSASCPKFRRTCCTPKTTST